MPHCPRDEWLNDYRVDARLYVQNRLSQPVLRAFRDNLADAGVDRAFEIGIWLRNFDNYFPERSEFVRWYKLVSYREALRFILQAESVEAVLAILVEKQPESRSLFRWSYVDQLVEDDIAFMLTRTIEDRLIADYRVAQTQMIEAYMQLCQLILRRYRCPEAENTDRFIDCSWLLPSPPTLSGSTNIRFEKRSHP